MLSEIPVQCWYLICFVCESSTHILESLVALVAFHSIM